MSSGAQAVVVNCGAACGANDETRRASRSTAAHSTGHDYVIANGKFALAADPDNPALKARMAEAEKAKAEERFLIPSTIGEEKATNPFLRAGEPALARSVKMEGAGPVAVFQALREWKNRF